MSVQVLLPGLSGKTTYLLNCHDGENVEAFHLLPSPNRALSIAQRPCIRLAPVRLISTAAEAAWFYGAN